MSAFRYIQRDAIYIYIYIYIYTIYSAMLFGQQTNKANGYININVRRSSTGKSLEKEPL
jgi:hypothetical protein